VWACADATPARAATVPEPLEVSGAVFADADDAGVVGVAAVAPEEAAGDDVFAVAAMQPVSTNTPATLVALAIRRARRAGCGRRRRFVTTLGCMIPPASRA
jgi:hypothetical protein